ncbi:MAG: metallopeptidase TldD-related protein [Pseudomonadota bacterium]
MLEKLAEKISKIAPKWEIMMEEAQISHLKYEGAKIKSIKDINASGICARIIKDGTLGFAYSTDFENVDLFCEHLKGSLAYGQKADYEFSSSLSIGNEKINCYDPLVADLSKEEMIKLGDKSVDHFCSLISNVELNLYLGKALATHYFLNSKGLSFKEKRSAFSMFFDSQFVEDDNILEIAEARSSAFIDLNPEEMVANLLKKYKDIKHTARLDSKKIPVIFTPEASEVLMLPLIMGFNGKNIALKTSPLSEKEGQKIFDPRLTLIDDGLASGTAYSSRFDHEGFPRSKKYLIKEGQISNFLLNLETAKQLNKENTGNGCRGSFGSWDGASFPSVSPTILKVNPGQLEFSKMLSNMQEGLLVDSVLGLGQGNVISGDFSLNVLLAYLVKNGEIAGRVKNVMISGNAYDILKDIDEIGKDVLWEKDDLVVPHIQSSRVSIVTE